MLSDKEIVKRFYGSKDDDAGHKEISESGLADQKEEDDLNRSFYNGDRSAYTHEMSVDNQKLAVCFNRVRPYIHSYIGFAAQNRRQSEFFAVEKDDQKRVMYTETANKWMECIRSTANAEQVETEQDKQHSICGYGVVVKDEDYTRNPHGEITYTETTRDFWWDPMSCHPGLSDRRWEFIKKKLSVNEAIKRFGGKEEDYQEAKTATYSAYEYYREGGIYDKIAYDWSGPSEKGMVYIYDYHWYDFEPYWRIKNPIFDEQYQQDGRASAIASALDNMKAIRMAEEENVDLFYFDPRSPVLALNKEQYDDVKEILDALGIDYEAEENLRKVYYEAILSGNKVFKKRKSTDQSGFVAKIKTADYDYENKLWFGMVSSLREPAKYSNSAITKFLLILASTSGPGYFYNVNMVPNVAEFEAKAALNAKALPIKGDPNIAIRDKQQTALPNGYDVLYPMFVKALSDVIGFAPEAMGVGDVSQPSFELEQQRIKQVMTTLAVYFDAITMYQKDDARSMPYYMRRLARNNEGRVIPIEKDGERTISQMYSSMIADEYSIDIGEMPDTPTKRKEQATVMQNFADKVATLAPQKAVEVYALAVEYLPIPSSDKSKWRNLLTPPPTPEAQAAAQKQQQLKDAATMSELQGKQAANDLKKAQAQKTMAEVTKVQTETDQTNLENLAMSTQPQAPISISI